MRLSNIAHLYFVRLKSRAALVQEILAILGISVGVALLFASLVASASLNGSVKQLTNGVVGKADYQLTARSPEGFNEMILHRVQGLSGVATAVPVLNQQVSLIGPSGREDVDLIASNPRAARLDGPLLRRFSTKQLAGQQVLALPTSIATAIGVGPLEPVKIEIDGRVHSALVASDLTEASIGSLARNPVALAPLAYAQQLTEHGGRITSVVVQAQPGRRRQVGSELDGIAAGRLNVEPAGFDATLFGEAAEPVNQSTLTFAIICALLGFMFAYCSMLLTIDMRRGLVRELRRSGSTRWEAMRTLIFDAFVLGMIASALGLALGDALSLLGFRTNPGYLSFAFPVGSQRIVTWQSVAISIALAVLAAGVGVITPIRDVWTHARDESSERRQLFGGAALVAPGAGIVCLMATTAILTFAPRSAIAGVILLMLALVLLLPLFTDGATAAFHWLQRRRSAGASVEIAVAELHSPKTRARSIAIAATGAIAVFGSVAIQGAHVNLQHGLNRLVHQLSVVADVWVLAPGEQNTLATTPLASNASGIIARLPGVRAVGDYYGGFLEYGKRRVWVLAPPKTAKSPVPPSQLISGSLSQVTGRLRSGGWAVISQGLAAEHGWIIGQKIMLPTARPIAVRVAGMSTNLGWPPGAIILNADDYQQGWESSRPSAYNVMLDSGASASQVSNEIRSALGTSAALTVETEQQREATQIAVSHQGLGRLTQMAALVLIAGVLATATSMGAAISQRRRRFARIKIHGLETRTLWGALLWESSLLFGAGGIAGAAFGIYGQLLLSHALMTVTGFPVIFSTSVLLAVGSFGLITVVAAAMIGVPGYRAASVQPCP